MTDATDTTNVDADTAAKGDDEQKPEQKFTQADIDKAVKDRLAREKAKYADYDDLKTKAEGAKTVEQKLAELEKKTADAEARALRSDIAARFQISAEDRDLFLTGTDEDTLTAQATRLTEREADRKNKGNVARKEGDTKQTGKANGDMRDFARQLFGNAD
ncbi:hypothetical protein [Leifsonia poae]|uniref:hypothetical protein n=1 Tax=Leifsonia poae TaxID=110933 RepID=UPI001CBC54CA|nr:hypothetical protein [Leifsonia poae]